MKSEQSNTRRYMPTSVKAYSPRMNTTPAPVQSAGYRRTKRSESRGAARQQITYTGYGQPGRRFARGMGPRRDLPGGASRRLCKQKLAASTSGVCARGSRASFGVVILRCGVGWAGRWKTVEVGVYALLQRHQRRRNGFLGIDIVDFDVRPIARKIPHAEFYVDPKAMQRFSVAIAPTNNSTPGSRSGSIRYLTSSWVSECRCA